jgi:hypothetical protein
MDASVTARSEPADSVADHPAQALALCRLLRDHGVERTNDPDLDILSPPAAARDVNLRHECPCLSPVARAAAFKDVEEYPGALLFGHRLSSIGNLDGETLAVNAELRR